MDLFDLIIHYGLYPVAISIICFLVCGIAKMFFVPKLKLKLTDNSLRQKKIREICQAIIIVLGAILLILCYVLLSKNSTFYLNLDFYLNLVAIPSITAMIYTIYQGKQDGKCAISIKKLLHLVVSFGLAIFTRKSKNDKTLELLSNLDKELDDNFALLPDDKEKLHLIVNKYIK